jgi:hypothetical protein
MSWVIRGYEKTDQLATEISLDDVVRAWFRRRLQIPESDPMFDSYPVSLNLLSEFLKPFGIGVDASQAFFLDYDASGSPRQV